MKKKRVIKRVEGMGSVEFKRNRKKIEKGVTDMVKRANKRAELPGPLKIMFNNVVHEFSIVPTPESEPSEEFKLLKEYVDADNAGRRYWEEKRLNPYAKPNFTNGMLLRRRLIDSKAAIHAYVKSKEPKPKVCCTCGRCIECGK